MHIVLHLMDDSLTMRLIVSAINFINGGVCFCVCPNHHSNEQFAAQDEAVLVFWLCRLNSSVDCWVISDE